MKTKRVWINNQARVEKLHRWTDSKILARERANFIDDEKKQPGNPQKLESCLILPRSRVD